MPPSSKIGFIYLIRNMINGKAYIGQTIASVSERIKRHRFEARRGSRQAIHCAIRKYGLENFGVIALASCPLGLLNELEAHYIQFIGTHVDMGNGYNMTYGGDGAPGVPVSLETRRKMALAHKGKKQKPFSAETRANMSKAKKGKPQSAEHVNKRMAAMKEAQRKRNAPK